jgi:hypothetical protein
VPFKNKASQLIMIAMKIIFIAFAIEDEDIELF